MLARNHSLKRSSGRIASFFHSSSRAAHILKSKHEMLNVLKQTLFQNVTTRWNSSYDMLQDVTLLSDQDVRMAEEITEVLKPRKTLMSTEATHSPFMTLPLKKAQLYGTQWGRQSNYMSSLGGDRRNPGGQVLTDFLHKCTALDQDQDPSSCLYLSWEGSTTVSLQRLWPWKNR